MKITPQFNRTKPSAPQLLAYPTEGVFGLGCMVNDVVAVEKIRRIKSARGSQARKPRKGYILLFHPQWRLQLYSSVSMQSLIDRNASCKINSAITWLLPYQAKPNHELHPALLCDGKIAVRVAQFSPLQQYLTHIGTPILSTSLNLAGQRPARSNALAQKIVDVITARFGVEIHLSPLRQGWQHNCPSAIIDWHSGQRIR